MHARTCINAKVLGKKKRSVLKGALPRLAGLLHTLYTADDTYTALLQQHPVQILDLLAIHSRGELENNQHQQDRKMVIN